jgi:hypothetical protein
LDAAWRARAEGLAENPGDSELIEVGAMLSRRQEALDDLDRNRAEIA